MAESRVIQDSDESDAELSDAGSSIDPLQAQDQDQEPPVHVRPEDREEGQSTVEGTRDDAVDWAGTGMVTGSSEPLVNFDCFLAMQNQDVPVSASQTEREEMWIDGRMVDTVGELGRNFEERHYMVSG